MSKKKPELNCTCRDDGSVPIKWTDKERAGCPIHDPVLSEAKYGWDNRPTLTAAEHMDAFLKGIEQEPTRLTAKEMEDFLDEVAPIVVPLNAKGEPGVRVTLSHRDFILLRVALMDTLAKLSHRKECASYVDVHELCQRLYGPAIEARKLGGSR